MQWTRANISKARVIELDENNCIICPVNYAVRSRSFDFDSKTDVILPAVGACVKRVRKAERPKLPEHALRLHQMYSHAISLHSQFEKRFLFDESRNEMVCAICRLTEGDVLTCAFCMYSMHRTCCDAVLTHKGAATLLQGVSSAFGQDLSARVIPNMFLATESSGSASSSSSSAMHSSSWSQLHVMRNECSGVA